MSDQANKARAAQFIGGIANAVQGTLLQVDPALRFAMVIFHPHDTDSFNFASTVEAGPCLEVMGKVAKKLKEGEAEPLIPHVGGNAMKYSLAPCTN